MERFYTGSDRVSGDTVHRTDRYVSMDRCDWATITGSHTT